MSDFRAYPRLNEFERLQISDGLAINAERWQHAHNYHRQRQNFQYQALYEPGIIYGLGVAIVPDQPDGRLLQIQPGVAIDIEGNPIIVKQPEEFRIASEPSAGQTLCVHLAVSHVDPDTLRRAAGTKTVAETFRLVEKVQLDPRDVELCRIQLQGGVTQLQSPDDVFYPSLNQLDFRGRCYPNPYPQFQVQVGQVTSDRATDQATAQGLTALLRSLTGLYPALRGIPTIQTVAANALGQESLLNCQVLYLPYTVLLTLSNPALQRLNTYLAYGSVLLVVADFTEVNLLELLDIGRELRLGLLEAERDRELFEQTGNQLKAEITANQSALTQRLTDLEQSLAPIALKLGRSLAAPGTLPEDHPLRYQPFVFGQLPCRLGHPIAVKTWDGLVLVVGDISRAWGGDSTLELPREVLRAAQEWGVNLLHFAAQRQQWMQSMQPLPTLDSATDSLQRRVQPM